MIPSSSIELQELQDQYDALDSEEISRTYQFRDDKISGHCDGIEAMKQTIYKIINTERYEYPIYSEDYGIETKDLVGESIFYVMPTLKRRITEALSQDDRIESVDEFSFFNYKGNLFITFTVKTKFGDVQASKEVP